VTFVKSKHWKRSFSEKPRNWKDNIKMDVREIVIRMRAVGTGSVSRPLVGSWYKRC